MPPYWELGLPREFWGDTTVNCRHRLLLPICVSVIAPFYQWIYWVTRSLRISFPGMVGFTQIKSSWILVSLEFTNKHQQMADLGRPSSSTSLLGPPSPYSVLRVSTRFCFFYHLHRNPREHPDHALHLFLVHLPDARLSISYLTSLTLISVPVNWIE